MMCVDTCVLCSAVCFIWKNILWLVDNCLWHAIRPIYFAIRRGIGQTMFGCLICPYLNSRKKFLAALFSICCFMSFVLVLYYSSRSRELRGTALEQQLALLRTKLQFIESQYRVKQEDVMLIQAKYGSNETNYISDDVTLAPEVVELLKNISGTCAAEAMIMTSSRSETIKTPFSLRLMPHLMENPHSLRPAYHLTKNRVFGNLVIGVPTVKRDKESYIMTTLKHLLDGMTEEQKNDTLIVVMIGETDLEYVINMAYSIETTYPAHVASGLIEILSPHASYYPDLETLPLTLGDSRKRVTWRTKQNLDAIYLMAYASTKGTYYTMLEDDVIAKKGYVTEINDFINSITVSNPNWFFINFSTIGGIGKVFRSSDLLHFITYVQLFYANMPIDWLLESYLADKICGIDKSTKQCGSMKNTIRPQYKQGLFQHIGLYSSLKGKIQKVKDNRFGHMPLFFTHKNPEVEQIICTIQPHANNTLNKIYEGTGYFWGLKPKKGDVVEFWFKTAIYVWSYLFRSGNVDHVSDRFYNTVIEVMPSAVDANYTVVGTFDEFGLAEGKIDSKHLPISAIRLRVDQDSKFWVLLSEVYLRTEPLDAP